MLPSAKLEIGLTNSVYYFTEDVNNEEKKLRGQNANEWC